VLSAHCSPLGSGHCWVQSGASGHSGNQHTKTKPTGGYSKTLHVRTKGHDKIKYKFNLNSTIYHVTCVDHKLISDISRRIVRDLVYNTMVPDITHIIIPIQFMQTGFITHYPAPESNHPN